MSESRKLFVDANVFLRVFAGGNQKQRQDSRAFIEAIEDGEVQAMTLSIVVAEVQWVTKSVYEFPKSRRVDILERLVGTPGLSIESSPTTPSVLLLYREHDVEFIDCMIAAHVQEADMPVVSYDTDFDTLGCERLEPDEVEAAKGE